MDLARRITAAALLLAVVSCAQTTDPLPGYRRAAAAQHDGLMRAVADYYEVRERALVQGDPRILFAAYPKLAQGEDLRSGINLDAFHVLHRRELGVIDMTDHLEGYEPARVYVKEGLAAVAYVHGWEVWVYPLGSYTGLEFFTRIDLAYADGRWVVERTDEQMVAEPPPRVPSR